MNVMVSKHCLANAIKKIGMQFTLSEELQHEHKWMIPSWFIHMTKLLPYPSLFSKQWQRYPRDKNVHNAEECEMLLYLNLCEISDVCSLLYV